MRWCKTGFHLDTRFDQVKNDFSGEKTQKCLRSEGAKAPDTTLGWYPSRVTHCEDNPREGPQSAPNSSVCWIAYGTDHSRQDNYGQVLKRILMCPLYTVEFQCIFRGLLFLLRGVRLRILDARLLPRFSYGHEVILQYKYCGKKRCGNCIYSKRRCEITVGEEKCKLCTKKKLPCSQLLRPKQRPNRLKPPLPKRVKYAAFRQAQFLWDNGCSEEDLLRRYEAASNSASISEERAPSEDQSPSMGDVFRPEALIDPDYLPPNTTNFSDLTDPNLDYFNQLYLLDLFPEGYVHESTLFSTSA